MTSTADERYSALFPRLVRFALLHLDLAAAEDAASLALQKLWLVDPDGDFDKASAERTAFSALRGVVSNELRARRRRRALFERLASFHSRENELIPDVMERIDEGLPVEVFRLLADLSSLEKSALVLVIDGFTVSEIAGVLAVSPASVSAALYRGRAKLRPALSGLLKGENS